MATIGLDATGFEAGEKRVRSSVDRIGGHLNSRLKGAIAGAFSVGAITAFSKAAIDAANRIKDLADQSGQTSDDVQRIDFAAKQVGSTFEDISGKLDKMGKARQTAIDGNSGLIGAFSRLGVGMDDLRDSSQTTLDIFYKIANSGLAIGRVDLMDVFGKGGGQIAATLESIRDSNGNGVFFKKEDLDSIDAFSESIQNAKANVMGFWSAIIANGAINPLSNFMDNLATTKAAVERMRDKHGWFGALLAGDELQRTRAQVIADNQSSQTPSNRQPSIREQSDALLNQMAADAANRKSGASHNPLLANAEAEAAINDKVAQMFSYRANRNTSFSGRSEGIQADSLARVGGFVGGAGSYDPSLTIATESFRVLQSIDRHLEEIKEINGGPAGGINGQFAP